MAALPEALPLQVEEGAALSLPARELRGGRPGKARPAQMAKAWAALEEMVEPVRGADLAAAMAAPVGILSTVVVAAADQHPVRPRLPAAIPFSAAQVALEPRVAPQALAPSPAAVVAAPTTVLAAQAGPDNATSTG
jgi:hypothetical protein